MINQLEEESHAKAKEKLPAARQRLKAALDDARTTSESHQLDELVALAEGELAYDGDVPGPELALDPDDLSERVLGQRGGQRSLLGDAQ